VDEPEAWEAAIKTIVAEQSIDVIVHLHTDTEEASLWSARLRTLLALLCLWASAPLLLLWALFVWLQQLVFGPCVENKFSFNQALLKGGLPCPETANMECLEDALTFFLHRADGTCTKTFIVKPTVYDPSALHRNPVPAH